MSISKLHRRLLTALCGSLFLTILHSGTSAAAPAAPSKPKLIVLIAIDGLPQRQVLQYRDQLAPDGFNRFLERGSWFSDARYGHSFTVTGPGHATMLTGAYPHRSGIIGNEWRDLKTGEREYCTGDTSATYIGHRTNPLDGTSPKNLKVETVGDVLRRASPLSKVITVSGKLVVKNHRVDAFVHSTLLARGAYAISASTVRSDSATAADSAPRRPANAMPSIAIASWPMSSPDRQPAA